MLSLHSCYSTDSCSLCLARGTLPYAFLGYSIGKQKKIQRKCGEREDRGISEGVVFHRGAVKPMALDEHQQTSERLNYKLKEMCIWKVLK